MNPIFQETQPFSIFFVLAAIWGLFVTIFWMVIAFRAMKAHELLAQAQVELVRKVDKIAKIISDKNA